MEDNIKEIKKQVIKDWQKAIPQLGQYSQNKIYKIIGPVISGIELIKLPHSQEYRPLFVLYGLWSDSVKECMQAPVFLEEFRNKKGSQVNIPYLQHTVLFPDIISGIKEQLFLPVEGTLHLSDLLTLMNAYSQRSPLVVAPKSYLQARLQEHMLNIAMYAGDKGEMQAILHKIQSMEWDATHFNLFNVNLEEWQHSMEKRVGHMEAVLAKIRANKADSTLAKLPASEVIL